MTITLYRMCQQHNVGLRCTHHSTSPVGPPEDIDPPRCVRLPIQRDCLSQRFHLHLRESCIDLVLVSDSPELYERLVTAILVDEPSGGFNGERDAGEKDDGRYHLYTDGNPPSSGRSDRCKGLGHACTPNRAQSVEDKSVKRVRDTESGRHDEERGSDDIEGARGGEKPFEVKIMDMSR